MIPTFEKFQNKVLKKLIPCPRSTPPALLRIMSGTPPFFCRVDMLKLLYFWKCLQAKNSKHSKLICCNRETSSNFAYCSEIFKLCCKYDSLWVWLGITKTKINKINPLYEIRSIQDLKMALESQCLYTTLCIMPCISNYKGSKVESLHNK